MPSIYGDVFFNKYEAFSRCLGLSLGPALPGIYRRPIGGGGGAAAALSLRVKASSPFVHHCFNH